jgi:hypothetical protein
MAHPTRQRRRATYEDLLAVPDYLVAEILDGELHTSPHPAPRHADASSGLGGALRGPFDRGRGGPGGWRILFEPELHLGADICLPDLAGWLRERLPRLPDEASIAIAPDRICEVVSLATAALNPTMARCSGPLVRSARAEWSRPTPFRFWTSFRGASAASREGARSSCFGRSIRIVCSLARSTSR